MSERRKQMNDFSTELTETQQNPRDGAPFTTWMYKPILATFKSD